MANSEIIGAGQDTARPAPKKILDACCSKRAFWFDKNDDRVVYMDKRNEIITRPDISSTGGKRVLEIKPDVQADFSNLPYLSETFSLVVFDPPHMLTLGANSYMARQYGKLSGEWRDMLRRGFSECFRVLKVDGVLIFKWNEAEVNLSDVLSLTEQHPLFGHKTNTKMNTHWVTFMKDEDRTSCAKSPAQNTKEICHTAPNTQGDAIKSRHWECPKCLTRSFGGGGYCTNCGTKENEI